MKFTDIQHKINTIIFDFGGVVINIEMIKTLEAFIRLGFESNNNDFYTIPFVKEFEKGLISEVEFVNNIKNTLDNNTDEKRIIRAWNELLIDIPSERITLITELRKKYRVILLSNTNITHIKASNEWLSNNSQFSCLDELFDKLYLSFEMKMSKPDNEIYLSLLKSENINPKNALFIDDSVANINAAKALGINTYLHPSNSNIVEYFLN